MASLTVRTDTLQSRAAQNIIVPSRRHLDYVAAAADSPSVHSDFRWPGRCMMVV